MHNGHVRIMVAGIGGGGGNAVDQIARACSGSGIEFVCINTDARALGVVSVPRTLQIGDKLTHGFGSGARPEIGHQAAEEDYGRIRDLFADVDLAFLAAGLGGGTGTGASPVVAKAAKDAGALTIAIVTKPFSFEGAKRAEVASAGLLELRQTVDTVICIPNDRITKLSHEQTRLEEAFRMTDDVLQQGVSAISELISRVGIVNIDYGDIATVLREPGDAMIGFGEASGENCATKAARYAMASPLLERNDIVGAKEVLVSITGGRDIKMKDVQEAVQCIHNEIRAEAHVIFGVITREDLEGRAHVTMVATGLPDPRKQQHRHSRVVKIPGGGAPMQPSLPLAMDAGLFAGIEPTVVNMVNYDTPTFARWGRRLLSDAA